VSTGTGKWGAHRQKLVERDVYDNSCGAGKERVSIQGRDINSILMQGHVFVQMPHKINTNVRMLAAIPLTSLRRLGFQLKAYSNFSCLLCEFESRFIVPQEEHVLRVLFPSVP
jgi:hypothetical protein